MLSSPQANRFMPGSDAAVIVNAVNLDAYSDAIAGHDPWLRRWFRDHWKSPIVSSALREPINYPARPKNPAARS
jgi:hypothetical protein